MVQRYAVPEVDDGDEDNDTDADDYDVGFGDDQ